MLSDRCLFCPVCLSVTLVYCGETVGWINMKLGVEVGLGHGHIVLDVDPASPKKWHRTPTFRPCLLWPNGGPSQLLLSTCLTNRTKTCKRSWFCQIYPTRNARATAEPSNLTLSSLAQLTKRIDYKLLSVNYKLLYSQPCPTFISA